MTTIVETLRNGQRIYKSTETYRVPEVDLLTLLFESSYSDAKPDTVIHASAAAPNQFITTRTCATLTRRTAHTLRHEFGIGANGPNKDIVTIISSGHHLLPVMFYGAIAAGGVFSAANAVSTPSELGKLMKGAGSKLLVTNSDTKDTAIAAAKEIGFPLDRVLIMGEGESWSLRRVEEPKKDLITEKELDWVRITDPKKLDESLIVLIYSSGTTGLPKGVKLSHKNMVAEAVIPLSMFKRAMETINPNFEFRTIGHLPTAHIAGIQGYFVNPFYQGGPVYWMARFDFAKFLEYNKKFKITSFFTVPPIYLLIAKSPAVTDQFDTLEIAISGAAPLGKELQIAASEKLGRGKAFIQQTWGLSETTGSITLAPPGSRDTTGSVSGLLANHEARIVDDDGKDVEVGKPGEIWVRGPVASKGYHDNEKANAEAYIDGWFCTGDIGLFKDGQFYIVDRKKELIKYKGNQVAPAELEALLLSHPDILDAAVIGVPHDEGTSEVPRAYVVADQKTISGDKIIQFVKENAAGHKQLRGGVVFMDAIPKSAAGKILRKDLRELVKREQGAKL